MAISTIIYYYSATGNSLYTARALQELLPIAIRARLAEKKLRKIAEAVRSKEVHDTWQLLRKFCARYHEDWRARQEKIDEAFLCDRAKCTSCGLCERICPRGNIQRLDGFPVWQHRCVECLGCLHICPVQAIDYGEVTRGRKRYRHRDVKVADLLPRGGRV